MRSFEKILKSLREDRKITQDDLAAAIGVSKQAVSHYERGTRFPKREQLEALADFFNVDIDYLTGRSSVTTKLLTDEERIAELSEMLEGKNSGASARNHAIELLKKG